MGAVAGTPQAAGGTAGNAASGISSRRPHQSHPSCSWGAWRGAMLRTALRNAAAHSSPEEGAPSRDNFPAGVLRAGHACHMRASRKDGRGPRLPAQPPEAAQRIKQTEGVAGWEAHPPGPRPAPPPLPRHSVGGASSQPGGLEPLICTRSRSGQRSRRGPGHPGRGRSLRRALGRADRPAQPVATLQRVCLGSHAMALSLALVLDHDQASRSRKRGLISSALQRGNRKTQAGPVGSWESGCFSARGASTVH